MAISTPPSCDYTPVTVSAVTTHRFLCGWVFRETSGATAVIRLREGDDSGDIAVSISLAANQSAGTEYPIPIRTADKANRWYCEVVSGNVEGAVYGD